MQLDSYWLINIRGAIICKTDTVFYTFICVNREYQFQFLGVRTTISTESEKQVGLTAHNLWKNSIDR